MTHEYLTTLGLAPGRYDPGELARSFQAQRRRLLAALAEPGGRADAARRLDDLYRAYAALRADCGSKRPTEHSSGGDAPSNAADADVAALREFIAASLEDGLLRFSRRREILDYAQRLNISAFHAQLLIADVQFGQDWAGIGRRIAIRPGAGRRAWPFAAAALLLAAAMFVALRAWLV